MSRRKRKSIPIANNSMNNTLTELVSAVKIAEMFTGGSTLSSYGTIAFSNNYSLITLNRIILTYLFTTNGIFQTAIQVPIQDALHKGVNIQSKEMKNSQIDDLMEWMSEPLTDELGSYTPWEVIHNMYTWARVYGGGGLVINTEEDPTTPLNIDNLYGKRLEMYDIDRWQMDFGSFYYKDMPLEAAWFELEYFVINGIKVHKSRILKSRGKQAPSIIRRQLRGWGMSEGERMIRDLNLYLKTNDVLYEILDESKIDVYKIKDFAKQLYLKGGTSKVQERITLANQLKNYVNALVLDLEEEFQQKTMTFTGLSEVMRENRINVAAALRFPMTKLFGLSASGFNTGESDLENYNLMVEAEVRAKIKPIIKKVLQIGCAYLWGFVPDFKFSYPSLRLVTAQEEENIRTNSQTRAIMLYDRGIINSEELAQMGYKDGWISIETKAGRGELPEFPTPPAQGELIKPPETRKIQVEPAFKVRKKPM